MILCPKCGKLNPPIKAEMSSHYTEECKNIIGYKKRLFGGNEPIYCNFFGAFDEDDDWHHVHLNEKNEVVLDQESELYSIYGLKEVIR